MRHGARTVAAWATLAASGADAPGRGFAWLADPRSAVLIGLAAVLGLGGGRKVLQGWRARRAVARLVEPGVTPEAIASAAEHGRAGLADFFRILADDPRPEARTAAGRALAALWRRDDLIAEEERALVLRGFAATWRARRRYPRAIRGPIPIAVDYGVPFLADGGPGVGPSDLEWSHRIAGAQRAGLEAFTPWRAGPGRAEFAIDPNDFESPGPHRLVLQARARTVGLTSSWEMALPQIPFPIEFDPRLEPDALLALADSTRETAIGRAVRLEPAEVSESGSTFLDLDADVVFRDPPTLAVDAPLPVDLAHALAIEFADHPGRVPAGSIVLAGQDPTATTRRFALGPVGPWPAGPIERPGTYRIRLILTPVPDLGWADPDVRSIWPGEIVTDWVDAWVVRR